MANKRARSKSSSSEGSSESIDSIVDVPFDFEDIEESDYHGVCTLINNLLQGCSNDVTFNFNSLADCIVNQQNIGVALKTDKESLVGVGTILNIQQYTESCEGLRQVVKFLEQYCPNLSDITTTSDVGVVLTERLFNVPGDVAPPMHQVLIEDVEWSQKECEDETERVFYDFDSLLVISHFLVSGISTSQGEAAGISESGKLAKPSKKKQRKDSKKSKEGADASSRIYMHPEDEVLLEFSQKSWFFKIGEHDDGKSKYPKYRLVYHIKFQDYQEAIKRLIEAA
jgi:protein BCP1